MPRTSLNSSRSCVDIHKSSGLPASSSHGGSDMFPTHPRLCSLQRHDDELDSEATASSIILPRDTDLYIKDRLKIDGLEYLDDFCKSLEIFELIDASPDESLSDLRQPIRETNSRTPLHSILTMKHTDGGPNNSLTSSRPAILVTPFDEYFDDHEPQFLQQTDDSYPEHLNPFGVETTLSHPEAVCPIGNDLNHHHHLQSQPLLAHFPTTSTSSISTNSSMDNRPRWKVPPCRSRKKRVAPSPPTKQRSPLITEPQPYRSVSAEMLDRIGRDKPLNPGSESDSRSVMLKHAAPPLPVYGKRAIKADPSERYLNSTEINEKLYMTHKQMRSLDSEIKDIQSRIMQGKTTGVLSLHLKKLLQERDSLADYHSELVIQLRQQTLEERHANLEHELRLLLAKQDVLKSTAERTREQELLQELLKTVEERAELVPNPTEIMHKPNSDASPSRPKHFHKPRWTNIRFTGQRKDRSKKN